MNRIRYIRILQTVCVALLIVVVWTACTPQATPTSAPNQAAPGEVTTTPAAPGDVTATPAAVSFSTVKITPLPVRVLSVDEKKQVTTILSKELPKGYEVMQLPEPIEAKLLDSSAKIITLPNATQVEQYKAEITTQGPTLNPNFNPALYNFSAVAHTQGAFNLLAVPVEKIPSTPDFTNGVQAGMIFDAKGFYSPKGTARVLEVWFYQDHAELRADKEVVLSIPVGDKFYWDTKVEHVDTPRVVFVENGCWGCWSLDSSCGCIYCSR